MPKKAKINIYFMIKQSINRRRHRNPSYLPKGNKDHNHSTM